MARRPSAFSALIAIDKPAGMTSHDVVSRVRRAVGEKRVGHAGTLDPAATGVLVVGIGQATKLLGLLTLDRKGYRATFQLGAETTTDDAEGEITRTAEVPGDCYIQHAYATVCSLVGWHDQVPPAYSAVSVGGRRAYDAARAGEKIELAARRVRIFDAHLVGVDREARTWELDLDVSKGTYVRSIARDLGRELGCYAHVSRLTRTFSGPVTLADCVSLEELAAGGAELARGRCLGPAAVLGLALRELDMSEVVDVSCGRRIEPGMVLDGIVSRPPAPGERVALTFGGGLAGIWERRGASLACSTNFPQAIEGVRAACALAEAGPDRPLDAPATEGLVRDALGMGGRRGGGSNNVCLAGGVVRGWTLERSGLDLEWLRPADGPSPDGTWRFAGENSRIVCAIGAFDGLHCGHQALIARARKEADERGAMLMAVTFTPDPARVLVGDAAPADLTLAGERPSMLFRLWDVDAVLVVDFTPEVAALPYERFVREVLGALGDVVAIVVGEDFRLGAGGAGDVAALSELGSRDGFDVVGMRLADAGGAPITSTRIRALLAEGAVEQAAALLGRCHHVVGEVEHGRGEGTGFGFPSANVRVLDGLALPSEGVYAGYVVVSRTCENGGAVEAYPAAINVGKPRSFSPGEEGAQFLEATLLGFEGDLYGQSVHVVFVRWLREPRRFDSVEELERTVLGNVDWVRQVLGEAPVTLSRVPDFLLDELVARSRGEVRP